MNKVVKSLALTFALAAGLGGTAAEAQTAGMPPQPTQAYTQTAVPAGQVSQQDIDNFAYNVGVQSAYPLANVGFSQGTLPSGQHVGIEYNLTGSQYTVRSAYNLDNPSDASAFQGEVNRAASTQASYQNSGYQVVYPQTYLYVEPVIAIRPFGFVGIYGWYPGYEAVFTPWFGFGYLGGRGYHEGYGRDGYRNDVRNVVVNNTYINERGGNQRPVGHVNGRTGVDTRDVRSFQGQLHGAALQQREPATRLRSTTTFQPQTRVNDNASLFRGNAGATPSFGAAARPASVGRVEAPRVQASAPARMAAPPAAPRGRVR